MAARSLNDLGSQVSTRTRLIILDREEVVIHQGALIGLAQELKSTEIICSLAGLDEDADLPGIHHEEYEAIAVNRAARTAETKDSSTIPAHLVATYDKAVTRGSPDEAKIIGNLMREYQDVFSKDETDFGCTSLTTQAVDTGDSKPIKQAPRRVPSALRHEEDDAIQKMKAHGVIRESSSPWASPIVLVRKKSDQIRPRVDYRRVNSVSRKDAYPIPRTQSCLDTLARSVHILFFVGT